MLLPAAPKYPDDYPAPRQFVLVVSCIDYRLLDNLVQFLVHENLTNRYFHVAFAGASLLLSGEIAKWPPPACGRPDGAPWKETLYAHVETVIALTGGKLSDVYIVEHRDCGAYEKFLKEPHYTSADEAGPDDEFRHHRTFSLALRDEMHHWFEEYKRKASEEQSDCKKQPLREVPGIHCFLMGLRGEVEELERPKRKQKK